jgi:hypothetical protein
MKREEAEDNGIQTISSTPDTHSETILWAPKGSPLPFAAYGFSQLRDCSVRVPTEPMLQNDTFTSLTGDHEIRWKYKVISAYNAIVEYYFALRPGKPFSQLENSWIEIVFTMAQQITNNRSAFNAKESARLDRIKRNSEDFSL